MPAIDWRRQMPLVGPFQQLVLLAVVREGPDVSAATVRRRIECLTGRKVSINAVHTTLHRLVERGYLSTWSRPIFRWRPYVVGAWKTCSLSMLRNGARRFFNLLTLGRRALRLSLQAEDLIRAGLPGLGREEALYRMHCPCLRWHDAGRPRGGRWSRRRGLAPERVSVSGWGGRA
jgi:hypothetical protein